jgi:hypothetical protein
MQKSQILVIALILNFITYQGISQQPDATTGATTSYSKQGNSLYHQTAIEPLIQGKLFVEGEIENAGEIDLSHLYKREVMTKESFLDDQQIAEFAGVFRYQGYSLFDILNQVKVNKKNIADFRPSIDLYIIIENAEGQKAVFSWSEIYYTNIPHQIIIATDYAPIKPHRKEVSYQIGKNWKIVAGNDLLSNRNIVNPVRITVKSFDKKEYVVNRDLDPLFSSEVTIFTENQAGPVIPTMKDVPKHNQETNFFGMGMGFHGNKSFEGFDLQNLIEIKNFTPKTSWLREGLVCVAAIDGYRAIFSYSELFNRTDQVQTILAVPEATDPSGYYRIFMPTDFYADRSVKALKEIYFFRE